LKALGIQHLFGLSTQDPAYQREAAERLHLPFPMLSDEHLKLTRPMNLPPTAVKFLRPPIEEGEKARKSLLCAILRRLVSSFRTVCLTYARPDMAARTSLTQSSMLRTAVSIVR
jgi:hypothetical protein